MSDNLHLQIGRKQDAINFIKQYHYLHRIPPPSMTVVTTLHKTGGLFGNLGVCVAACVFGTPTARWSEKLLELHRLVGHPDIKTSLTQLMTKTIAHIEQHKIADLLVSYVACSANYYEDVYRETSWNFGREEDSGSVGLIVDGEPFHGRTCNHTWGTRSVDIARERFPHLKIEPLPDEGKFFYWKALTESGQKKARRLELPKSPHPTFLKR